jgi:DNA replication and repair protein RecF
MRLGRLLLTDFRSYPDLRLDLPKGTTTLLGKNGAGKTNIVEAIRYLGTLTSHRVATDVPLIRTGCNRAIVRGTVEKANRELGLEVTIVSGGANSARLNLSPVRPRDIAGILRTVIFSPEDIDLVKGDPACRRRFLDEICVALIPRLSGDLSDYERVVRQKGTLLKTLRGRGSNASALEVWDEKLAHLGARIIRARADTVEALDPHAATAYADVAIEGAPCSLSYASSIDGAGSITAMDEGAIEGALLQAIARESTRERERGVCLVGPHRDDLVISIGELPARGFASHGESWSAALALRLGVYGLLTEAGGPDSDEDGEPILILDDVFAELDGVRRAALADRASTARQVIVTAAVGADVPQALGGEIFMIDRGTVTPGG